jgi:hypothetical protein
MNRGAGRAVCNKFAPDHRAIMLQGQTIAHKKTRPEGRV